MSGEFRPDVGWQLGMQTVGAVLSAPARLGGNTHTVLPGELFRSALLRPSRLHALLLEYKIQTVISLMGGDEGDPWFLEQHETCRRAGATLAAIRLSTRRLPRPAEMARLVALLETVRSPVLLHCRSGADRTGLATALYLHLRAGRDLEQAIPVGLSWRYGHLPTRARALTSFFLLYQATSAGEDLPEWVAGRYPELYPLYRRGYRTHPG